MCGQTCGKKRPNKGLLFLCQNCHDTLHSALVGARKSALRTLLIRQDWVSTGELSDRPDVSDREAKAAPLQRDALLAVESRHKPLALAMGYLTISSCHSASSEEVGLVASACCSGAVCSTSSWIGASWFCGKSTVCSNGPKDKTTGGGMGFATGAN